MIGLLPAAGKAERLYGLPKYLLPIPGGYLLKWHIEQMFASGSKRVIIGANKENRELIDLYARPYDGFVYHAVIHDTMSQTLLASRKMYSQRYDPETTNILFGMPDTYWTHPEVYRELAHALASWSVAAALFRKPPLWRSRVGICDFYADGKLTQVIDKPRETDLEWAWIALAWRPEFWQYIQPDDLHVGFALQRAIEVGIDIRALCFEGQSFDAGSLEGYYELLKVIMG